MDSDGLMIETTITSKDDNYVNCEGELEIEEIVGETDPAVEEAESESTAVAKDTESTNEVAVAEPEKEKMEITVTEDTGCEDGGWEVVCRRKQQRAVLTARSEVVEKNDEEFFENRRGQYSKKARLSVLDRLSNQLNDQKVVPVNHADSEKSLQYLRHQWKHWVFGRVIRIQGMSAVFFFLFQCKK